jgi:hypothetical protein
MQEVISSTLFQLYCGCRGEVSASLVRTKKFVVRIHEEGEVTTVHLGSMQSGTAKDRRLSPVMLRV